MKKALIIFVALVLAVTLLSCENISFSFPTEIDRKNSKSISPTENVYEEIWNLVLKESKGQSTVLVNIGTDSCTDYDFGTFSKVIIDNRLSLSFHTN